MQGKKRDPGTTAVEKRFSEAEIESTIYSIEAHYRHEYHSYEFKLGMNLAIDYFKILLKSK
jgi:hypothetical protein